MPLIKLDSQNGTTTILIQQLWIHYKWGRIGAGKILPEVKKKREDILKYNNNSETDATFIDIWLGRIGSYVNIEHERKFYACFLERAGSITSIYLTSFPANFDDHILDFWDCHIFHTYLKEKLTTMLHWTFLQLGRHPHLYLNFIASFKL